MFKFQQQPRLLSRLALESTSNAIPSILRCNRRRDRKWLLQWARVLSIKCSLWLTWKWEENFNLTLKINRFCLFIFYFLILFYASKFLVRIEFRCPSWISTELAFVLWHEIRISSVESLWSSSERNESLNITFCIKFLEIFPISVEWKDRNHHIRTFVDYHRFTIVQHERMFSDAGRCLWPFP